MGQLLWDLISESYTRTGPEVHAVRDQLIPVFHPEGSVTIRIYIPAGNGPFPVHVNFHGGKLLKLK